MKSFIVYNSIGEILRCGWCPDDAFLLQALDGEIVIEGIANDLVQFVQDGIIKNKQVMEVTVDKTTVVEDEALLFQNILVGTTINVDGDIFVENDGYLELKFDTVGEYKVKMYCFPYLDYEVTIICN